jgi:4-hydroxybenzoate polyprenyltransferase
MPSEPRLTTLQKFARLTKIEHILFALPFSLASMLYAKGGIPELRTLFLILLALISGRSLGMASNRLIDRRVDAHNPRTEDRMLPRGQLGVIQVKFFAMTNALLLAWAAWSLNPLCLKLLPLAGLLLLGYSYAKFYTSACHLILGATLGSAAAGAWLAVTGEIQPPVWFLFAGVSFWAAGFDIVYACQDIDFDRRQKLHSIPASLGRDSALDVAAVSHVLSLLALAGFGWSRSSSSVYFTGLSIMALLIAFEHFWARTKGDAVVQQTFFYANAGVSLVFLATAILEVLY